MPMMRQQPGVAAGPVGANVIIIQDAERAVRGDGGERGAPNLTLKLPRDSEAMKL
jgi:hypothetical protein